MQKGRQLHFQCLSCEGDVPFSVFALDQPKDPISCIKCQREYTLEDEDLKRQLKKFEALCQQIVESEEILGNASVGVDIGNHQVKIPYKLLLTRLNSSLDLDVGGKKLSVSFRLEPTKDLERIK